MKENDIARQCDLCSNLAVYDLCQYHLNQMTGEDEHGKTAIEREAELKDDMNNIVKIQDNLARENYLLKRILLGVIALYLGGDNIDKMGAVIKEFNLL